MKKNDRLVGTCIDYTAEGLGIVKSNDFVFFVKNVLVNEKIEFVITNLKKNYGFGHCVNVLEKSENRIEPICPLYKQCGGCHLQHMNRAEQANFKTNKVKQCFERIAHLDVDVLPVLDMEEGLHYRNKVQIPVGLNNEGKIISGFYRNHTHDIIDCADCAVQSDLQNEIHQFIKSKLDQYSFSKQLRHLLIKHAFRTDEVMVVLICRTEKLSDVKEFVQMLTKHYSCIKSVILNVNNRDDNVILGEKEITLFGSDTIKDRLGDYYFNISSKSFYQINVAQTEVLYSKAIEYAKLSKEDVVMDLYCGIGTIGMFASKHCKNVLGVEIVEDAIVNAKENAMNNQIGNIEFICGDAGTVAQKLVKENASPDVIIVDPPRKGMDENTIDAIVTMGPDRLVYVSCDPATLARDCAILDTKGYHAQVVQPVDMFPLTHHVETVVLMSKVNTPKG